MARSLPMTRPTMARALYRCLGSEASSGTFALIRPEQSVATALDAARHTHHTTILTSVTLVRTRGRSNDISANPNLVSSSPWWSVDSSLESSAHQPDTDSQQLFYGTNFAGSHLVKKALESFYGIGPKVSIRVMARHHIHPTAQIGTLGDRQVTDLTAELSTMKIENDLRRTLQDNIKRLRDMGTYRGRRHAMSLPVRGQNTRTQVSFCRGWIRMGHGRFLAGGMLTAGTDFDGEEAQQGQQERLIENTRGWLRVQYSALGGV